MFEQPLLPGLVLSDTGLPLDLIQVQDLFDRVDWSFVAEYVRRSGGHFGRHNPISMCKAHALPYLTRIHSETDLARRLAENAPYRVVCGFRTVAPTRTRLYKFRNPSLPGDTTLSGQGAQQESDRKSICFNDLLFNALLRLVVASESLHLSLPFVYHPAEDHPDSTHHTFKIVLDNTREFQVSYNPSQPLPADVFNLQSGQAISRFALYSPPWWTHKYAPEEASASKERRSWGEYTACSAVIVSADRRQVLLGRRKGTYGDKFYALPGGKRLPNESLAECIKREVWQEVGLRVLHSRPVSISLNQYRVDAKECWSIGALVTHHEGVPINKEPTKCAGWDWFDIDSLPFPLFRPTEIVLHHYAEKTFGELAWEDVEDIIVPERIENRPRTTEQMILLAHLSANPSPVQSVQGMLE